MTLRSLRSLRSSSWNHLVTCSALALLLIAGCGKKAPLPPPPPPPSTQPTAEITATPTSINAGDRVIVAWRVTNASTIQIEGIGTVQAEGTQSVTPAVSTKFHLTASGDNGTAEATAFVTVNSAPPPPPPPVVATTNDVVDDAMFKSNVQDVYFDYDSYDVRSDESAVISKDASFLVAHPSVKIVIGGYCDERGSNEYNVALGENRANSAKQSLVTAGVSPERIRVVSYGKEKQFCSEHDEACWQQNRRGQILLDK